MVSLLQHRNALSFGMLVEMEKRFPSSGKPANGPVFKRITAVVAFRTGLLQLAGHLRRLLRGPRLIVLCYHRVSDEAAFPALSASPAEFARQATWFGKRFQVLPLESVSGYLQGRLRLERDAIVLTFDDGYADNFHAVLPILRRHGMPATYFISSEPLLLRKPYWYDLFWSLLHNENVLRIPEELSGSLPRGFRDAWSAHSSFPDRFAKQNLLNAAKALDNGTRLSLLNCLLEQRNRDAMDPDCALMTLEEARIAESNGIAIGAHTRTHPSLAKLNTEDCRSEIEKSVSELLSNGFRVRHFAYPFGTSADTGGRTGLPRSILAGLGTENRVTLAVTTEERAVSPSDDPLLIPRKVITPQSIFQIAMRLERLAWSR